MTTQDEMKRNAAVKAVEYVPETSILALAQALPSICLSRLWLRVVKKSKVR